MQSMTHSLAIAAAALGMNADPNGVELKTSQTGPDFTSALNQMALAFDELGSSLRSVRVNRSHPKSKPSKVEAIHRALARESFAKMQRRRKGRFAGKAFGSPAKPNLCSHFHVLEMQA